MENKNHGKQAPVGARAPRPPTPAGQESSVSPPPSAEHPAIAAYRAAFGRSPTDRQATAIAAAVSDLARWRKVLDDWHANAWRVESVGKMLDRYRNQSEEHSHAPPAQRPTDGRPNRPSAAPTPEELARFLNRLRPGAGQHGT
jgi:hypothetical protein